MRNFLRGKKLLGYITGTCVKPKLPIKITLLI